MTLLHSLIDVLAAIQCGAYVVHVPEALAPDVARGRPRGFVMLDPVHRADGERTVAFVHSARADAIRRAMDGRFSALSDNAIRYLRFVYGPDWYLLAT